MSKKKTFLKVVRAVCDPIQPFIGPPTIPQTPVENRLIKVKILTTENILRTILRNTHVRKTQNFKTLFFIPINL